MVRSLYQQLLYGTTVLLCKGVDQGVDHAYAGDTEQETETQSRGILQGR